MRKNRNTPCFEVDLATRLQQKQAANRAVRLPVLGFRRYRVYNNDHSSTFAQLKSQKTNKWSWILQVYLDKYAQQHCSYQVKWLKPKQVTLLRLKGHRVEQVDDQQ
jgi:hypothetical protein